MLQPRSTIHNIEYVTFNKDDLSWGWLRLNAERERTINRNLIPVIDTEIKDKDPYGSADPCSVWYGFWSRDAIVQRHVSFDAAFRLDQQLSHDVTAGMLRARAPEIQKAYTTFPPFCEVVANRPGTALGNGRVWLVKEITGARRLLGLMPPKIVVSVVNRDSYVRVPGLFETVNVDAADLRLSMYTYWTPGMVSDTVKESK
jgi:hypothetical protein